MNMGASVFRTNWAGQVLPCAMSRHLRQASTPNILRRSRVETEDLTPGHGFAVARIGKGVRELAGNERREVTSASVWHVLGLEGAVPGPVTWPFIFWSELMPRSCVHYFAQEIGPIGKMIHPIRQNEKSDDFYCKRRAEVDEGDESLPNRGVPGTGRLAILRSRTRLSEVNKFVDL